jgi:hypothetical protein
MTRPITGGWPERVLVWIEGGSGPEHGAGDGVEHAVIEMATLSQFDAVATAAGTVLGGGPRPAVDGRPQSDLAGLPHEDHASLAAASSDGRGAR